MKAVTHTEVYRPFQGSLEERRLRFAPIVSMGVRTAAKRRLPLLLLYAPPAIATIVFSFVVYGTYAATGMLEQAQGDVGLSERMAMAMAQQTLKQAEVQSLILQFHRLLVWFTLLVTTWYGSGLFCDDRKVGAHQLYFARPLTRLDYFLGKFFHAAFFAACALLVPGMILCLMASFLSPDWQFLRERGHIILRTFAYEGLWVLTVSAAVLAGSSLAAKRAFALVGIFGFFLMSLSFATLLGEEVSSNFFALSPILSLWRIGDALFESDPSFKLSLSSAWTSVVAFNALFLTIIAWRLRRLEVVA